MKRKILVIEDELEVRTQIVRLLELNEYDTISAGNGISGLQMILQNLPDLIISDIMMPELDGYELLEEVKKYPETSEIPFLFLSARTDRSDIRQGMNLGANDYLTKPFSLNELLDAVNVHLLKNEKQERRYKEKFEALRTSIRHALPHEIRTPLNAILGFCDILRKKSFQHSTEVLEMINHIYESSIRLNSLFEKYLFYANIEILASNPVEMSKMLERRSPSAEIIILDTARLIAEHYDRASDLQIQIEDAVVKMSESNLIKLNEEIIDNAFKYSEKGSPVIINSKKQNDNYLFCITDHGRGMNPEQLKNLGAYMQFDRKIYEQQGTGLGITIAKRLIELHNGSLVIDSEPDYFTSVTVTLSCD